MKKFVVLASLCGFVLGSFTPAFAQDEKKPKKPVDRAAQFKRLDKNKDGKLSKDEFVASRKTDEQKANAEKQFTRLDKDKDGSISEAEFTAAGKPKKGS